jgi:hypothetical protein
MYNSPICHWKETPLKSENECNKLDMTITLSITVYNQTGRI